MTAARFALLCTLALSGCMTFSPIRPAAVTPGTSFVANASFSTPPGENAKWFWDYSDGASTNSGITGVDAQLTFGKTAGLGRPKSFALGVNGIEPYVDGYVQKRSGASPAGVGFRFGGIAGWWTEQVYWRVDQPLSDATTVAWSPSIIYHSGNSPNGENPGSFLGFVNGFGLVIGNEGYRLIPSVSVVLARSTRTSYADGYGPTWSVFATAGLGVCLCQGRTTRP